jgi:hypothetical protein
MRPGALRGPPLSTLVTKALYGGPKYWSVLLDQGGNLLDYCWAFDEDDAKVRADLMEKATRDRGLKGPFVKVVVEIREVRGA